VVCELTAHNAEIEWKAHLANKKAAWFEFDGASKALRQFLFHAEADNHGRRNSKIGAIVRNEERQRFESDRDRRTLEIDGGGRSITGVNRAPAPGREGDALRFKGLFKGPARTLHAPAETVYNGHEVYLGELHTDEDGRLVVLGGHGVSEPVGPLGPAKGSERHNYWITNYANNDHWHDDTSDGPVSAKVRVGGREIEVRGGAWVVVAPPDYAPDVTNLVTLYDVMEEVAVAARLPQGAGSPVLRDLHTVSFQRDIFPILERANDLRWVSPLGLRGHGYAKPGVLEGSEALAEAVQSSDAGDELRQRFFRAVREPNYEGLDPETGQSVTPDRAVAKAQAIASFMPPLSGDEGGRTAGEPGTWMTLTRLQYRRLKKWSEGDFERDDAAPDGCPPELKDQPARLTRCALEASCGGAFFPGIETTVIVRSPRLYSEAFRIDHDRVDAGDITKFMACPWQADFYECRDDWWPGQRPDEVITDEAFEELFASFEEEKKKAGKIEEVLFRRERWDRGLDKKPRPKREWLLDRLLPAPTTADADEYALSVARRGARLLASLAPIAMYDGYADRGTDLEVGPDAERLPNPWRIQYVSQEQFDGYAGRYFLPTVLSPEVAFETPLKMKASDASIKTMWQFLSEEFGDVPGADSLAALRRNWKTVRLSNPKFVGRVVGIYCRAISQDLVIQIEKIVLQAPKPKGKPEEHDQPNGALQVRYNLLNASTDPISEPKDFDVGSEEFKRLRAGEFVMEMISRLFLIFVQQAPDMAMIDEWRHLGFVTRHRIEANEAKGIAASTVQIETERARYEGKSYRDYFYYLMNIEEYPDFLPYARVLALQTLRAAQSLIDLTGIYDPNHPESYVPYSPENFTAKLEQIYEILRSASDRPQRYVYNTTRAEEIQGRVNSAPFNQTDGAWLRYAANAGTIDKVRSLLFEVWSDEVGNGDPSLHHGNLFTDLLRNLGVYLPEVSSRAYADDLRFQESDFIGPVFQLAISQHSEEFLPELLGMTLFLEWEVLTLAPVVRRREYLGIDPQFWQMHVAIDNASEGHGAMAKEAIEFYLDRVLNDGGPEAQQEHWRRIWRGFVAFATGGYDLFQNEDGMSTEAEQSSHPSTPADRIAEIMERKKHFGNRNHQRSQLGPHRINDLFDNPRLFLDQLANSPWIVPGDPDGSRLLSYLTTFEGPMYKVFAKDDLATWRDWIVWLAKEGDTARPKVHVRRADAMKILLADLRQLMIASGGHRVYRVPSTRVSLSELFASSDLDAVMKALRDPANGWIVPFRPWESAIIVDLLKPGRRMGAALDQRFPQLFDQVGRMVIYEWILSGCRLPSEPVPPEEKYSVPKRPPKRLFVQQLGKGAVH
jgi:hypothetical protein